MDCIAPTHTHTHTNSAAQCGEVMAGREERCFRGRSHGSGVVEPGAAEAGSLMMNGSGDAVLVKHIDVPIEAADASGGLVVLGADDEDPWHALRFPARLFGCRSRSPP